MAMLEGRKSGARRLFGAWVCALAMVLGAAAEEWTGAGAALTSQLWGWDAIVCQGAPVVLFIARDGRRGLSLRVERVAQDAAGGERVVVSKGLGADSSLDWCQLFRLGAFADAKSGKLLAAYEVPRGNTTTCWWFGVDLADALRADDPVAGRAAIVPSQLVPLDLPGGMGDIGRSGDDFTYRPSIALWQGQPVVAGDCLSWEAGGGSKAWACVAATGEGLVKRKATVLGDGMMVRLLVVADRLFCFAFRPSGPGCRGVSEEVDWWELRTDAGEVKVVAQGFLPLHGGPFYCYDVATTGGQVWLALSPGAPGVCFVYELALAPGAGPESKLLKAAQLSAGPIYRVKLLPAGEAGEFVLWLEAGKQGGPAEVKCALLKDLPATTAAPPTFLPQRPDDKLLADLLAEANDPRPAVRAEAIRRVGQLCWRRPEALPFLLSQLRHPDGRVVSSAVEVLAQWWPVSVPALVQALNSEDAAIRRGAANVLLGRWLPSGYRPGPEEVLGLRRALQDQQATVRAVALCLMVRHSATVTVKALGYDYAAVTVPLLGPLLANDAAKVSTATLSAIEELGVAAKGLLPDVAKLLECKDHQVRADCATALGAMKDPAAVPLLLPLLDDPDEQVQRRAIGALGMIGPPAVAAVPRLRKSCRHPSEMVRCVVLAYLPGFADRSAIPDVARCLLKDANTHVRRNAADALGVLGAGDPVALKALQKALKDKDAEVGAAAIRAFAKWGAAARPVIPLLVELGIKDADKRRAMKEAIEKASGPETPALLRQTAQQTKDEAAREWLVDVARDLLRAARADENEADEDE